MVPQACALLSLLFSHHFRPSVFIPAMATPISLFKGPPGFPHSRATMTKPWRRKTLDILYGLLQRRTHNLDLLISTLHAPSSLLPD
ncbi:hypothetical protein H4582DRAFT_1977610 [Lactarius indigo]|nr:hypothetical protein H4582DRAFT_1977610 [Lactarius indigo]